MKKTIFLITFVGVFILLFILQIPQYLYKYFTLRNTYSEFINLDNSHVCEKQYDYLLPSEKFDTTLEIYTAECSKNKFYSEEATINSVKINGDEGYINRTLKICYSETCTGKDLFENTGLKKYFYINGKWYFSQKESNILCTRTQPYPLLPEFQRALSLIKERLENSQYAANTTFEKEDRSTVLGLKKIYNCLDIQYASNDEELNGAEGVFKFDNTSSTDDLKIFVSPKYQTKDDLLTATVLSHEITHAFIHASGADKKELCYQNEAYAFTREIIFYAGALNDEERQSIHARYYTSAEAKDLIDLTNAMNNYGDKFMSDRTLKYVKQNPFYQQQCGRSK